jgi:hypothetical protein
MIWKFALVEPRTITISGDYWGRGSSLLTQDFITNKSFPRSRGLEMVVRLRAPVSELLQTNREARIVGLSNYKLVEISMHPGRSLFVYFDFEKDRVVIPDESSDILGLLGFFVTPTWL